MKAIDLAAFVNTEVVVYLRNGRKFVTTLRKGDCSFYPYSYYAMIGGNTRAYSTKGKNGLHIETQYDIMHIEKYVEAPLNIITKQPQIDLEEFVGMEVIITNNADSIRVGTIVKVSDIEYPYVLQREDKLPIPYNRAGYSIVGNDSYPFNIKHIELKQPQKTMTSLSNATIDKLADALTADAIKYLENDEEVIQTTVNAINRFLIDRMGQMDDTLLSELSDGIFEKINIVSDNK